MTASVGLVLLGFSLANVSLVLWSQWATRHRIRRVHDRLDIQSADLAQLQGKMHDVEARVSVAEQERRWQEEVRRGNELFDSRP